MQKCPHHHFKDTSMDHYIVKTFAEKLGNLSISDYHGLRSPGLTCFLNSVLQVLFMTDNFREAVKSNCSTSLDQHLAELFYNLERNMAETHSITKHLGIKDVYEQRDAAEYFEKILCQTSNIASQIFKGELNHETRCHNCKQTNNSKNLFWLLPLSMHDSSRKSFNLQQGLEDFFKVQKVSGENQMFCNRCDKKQDADTKYEMKQSPDVLTLLLKRFTLDYRQSRYKKLQSSADVVPTLNIEGCSYDLYAVVHHYGDLSGGHYTADIKSFETGTWYCFDDRVVTRVAHYFEKNSIRSSTAYLLMYRKVSGQPAKLDVDAQSGRSGVEAEDRRDETETGNALVSEHLKSESCRREDYTHMNGYTLSDELRRKRASSLEKQSRKAEREFMLNQRFTETYRRLLDCNLNTERTCGSLSDTNSSALMLGLRQNSPVKGQKVNEMTEMQYNRKKTRTDINLSDRSPSRDRNNQSKDVSHQREATAVQEPNMKMTKDSRNGFSKSPRKDKTGRPRETKNVQKSVKEKKEQPWK